MIIRTPPARKRRAESQPPEDGNNNTHSPSSSKQLLVYEDLPAPEYSHDHSTPITSDQMLCTYQCRQMRVCCMPLASSLTSLVPLVTLKYISVTFLVPLGRFRVSYGQEKQAHDYQSKFEALNEDFSKAEAERKNFRDKFFNAEQELAAAKGREQMLQEQLRKEIDFSQEQLRKQIQSYSELEVKFRNEMDLRKKAESLAAKAEEKASLLEKMECRAKNAEKESALLKEQLEELKKRLDEESEVREARKIKASHEDIQLLKEKLYEEKNRRERAELDLLKLSDLQLNVKRLEDELSTWKSVVKEIPAVSSADDIIPKFAALQKEVVDSMMKASEAQVCMKEIQASLDSAVLDKQNAETEASMAKDKAESYKAEIKRLELMVTRFDYRRKRPLKNVVQELREPTNRESGTELFSGTIVQELEASLAKKENYVKELENSLLEKKEINSRQHNEIMLLNERLTNEARRVKMLEREGDRLRSDISLLESKLGHGDFSSANTKVLRMVNTLAVDNEAKQTIDALQNELQKAKEKLQAVEELKKQSVSPVAFGTSFLHRKMESGLRGCGLVLQASLPADAGTHVDSYIAGKIKQLKEQIATLEKREERYKTVFAERISVFRRACCELFGYKIVMDDHQRPDGIPVTRFTLHSIYALSDDEKLQFEYESGNTNIVVNEYASQPEISRQVDIFIRKMNSIPAFTANLTVESFNKRTLS
ncbi:hypothetical protein DH2020_003100 [Rehmannia glutinosa]|uniref:Mitotic spindle checkpoint protein MAD1 n=1 Tax=Rehmannia glutinosa TaxID=99300 RepID=A0ABR0XKL7_REHGL